MVRGKKKLYESISGHTWNAKHGVWLGLSRPLWPSAPHSLEALLRLLEVSGWPHRHNIPTGDIWKIVEMNPKKNHTHKLHAPSLSFFQMKLPQQPQVGLLNAVVKLTLTYRSGSLRSHGSLTIPPSSSESISSNVVLMFYAIIQQQQQQFWHHSHRYSLMKWWLDFHSEQNIIFALCFILYTGHASFGLND